MSASRNERRKAGRTGRTLPHNATNRGVSPGILGLKQQAMGSLDDHAVVSMRSGIGQAVRIEEPNPLQAGGIWASTFSEAEQWIQA